MELFFMALAACAAAIVGLKLGQAVAGTYITGLRLAIVLGTALVGTVIGAVIGLVGAAVGVNPAFELFGSFTWLSALFGLAGGLVGCGAGYVSKQGR